APGGRRPPVVADQPPRAEAGLQPAAAAERGGGDRAGGVEGDREGAGGRAEGGPIVGGGGFHGRGLWNCHRCAVARLRCGEKTVMSLRVASASGRSSRAKRACRPLVRPVSPSGTQSAKPSARIMR